MNATSRLNLEVHKPLRVHEDGLMVHKFIYICGISLSILHNIGRYDMLHINESKRLGAKGTSEALT